MTAVAAGPAPVLDLGSARPGRLRAATRMLRLELRHNAMLGLIPVAALLFWFTAYRKAMAAPPLWSLRAAIMQSGGLLAFIFPVTGAAAWMGSREARRRTADVVGITARSRWVRQLATWAATTIWALLAYFSCAAVLYVVTAHQATGGGPLWWPLAVGAASLPALSALGFAVGALAPSRFTAPLTSIASFFALALSTQLITGSQSYWQVSPVVTGPWDDGFDPGVATFYHYLPDLAIAQTLFLAGLAAVVLGALALSADWGRRSPRTVAATVAAAGLLASVTAVAVTGTGKLGEHGQIAIPALHDAASDRPIRFTPVCSHTAIPICLNPAYAFNLPSIATALGPAVSEIAGLPGAPVRISQAGTVYQQGTGNGVGIGLAGPTVSGTPPTYHILLPDQFSAPALTPGQLAEMMRSTVGPALVSYVIGAGPAASPAQRAVFAALLRVSGQREQTLLSPSGPSRTRSQSPSPRLRPRSPVYAAALRFAALPSSTRHTWLMHHLSALRAGQITLGQLP